MVFQPNLTNSTHDKETLIRRSLGSQKHKYRSNSLITKYEYNKAIATHSSPSSITITVISPHDQSLNLGMDRLSKLDINSVFVEDY